MFKIFLTRAIMTKKIASFAYFMFIFPIKKKKKKHCLCNELQTHGFQKSTTPWISFCQCAFYISNHTRYLFTYAQFNNAQQKEVVECLFSRPKTSVIGKRVLQACNRIVLICIAKEERW